MCLPETTDSRSTQPTSTKKAASKTKKKAVKTMFPNMVAAAKKGAESDLEDLIHLQKQTIGK